MDDVLNVLGTPLQTCGTDPMTGWFRDGCCNTDMSDFGVHTVCCSITNEFLDYSQSRGNDLSTPKPEAGFLGLKHGDRWCLCAGRWLEAYKAGKACPVFLEGTHEETLAIIPLKALQEYKL